MPPSELRKEARESLTGNWKKGVCIVLAYFLITFALNLLKNAFTKGSYINLFIQIAITLITVPIAFGLISSFMKLKRGQKVSAFDFLEDGFKNFTKAWGIQLWTMVKLILPIICLIIVCILMISVFSVEYLAQENFNIPFAIVIAILYIACITYIVVRSLLFILAQHIAIDNPEMKAKDCVLKSQEMMKGNRGSLFLLELSFIGWSLLAVLTLGIGFLWLIPYMQVALVCFYDNVKNK